MSLMLRSPNEPVRVFISYVRENVATIERLVRDLEAGGLEVWYDRKALSAGMYWKEEVRSAIQRRDYFIACFTREAQARDRSYMREELSVAIDEMRLRSFHTWFIPVLLSGSVPNIPINAHQTLLDIHYIDFTQGTWSANVTSLIDAITSDARRKYEEQQKLLNEVFPKEGLGRRSTPIVSLMSSGRPAEIFESPSDNAAASIVPYNQRLDRSHWQNDYLREYRTRVYNHLQSCSLSEIEQALLLHLIRGPLIRPESVSQFYASVESCATAMWPKVPGDPTMPNLKKILRVCYDQDGEWQLRLFKAAEEPVVAFLTGRPLDPYAN